MSEQQRATVTPLTDKEITELREILLQRRAERNQKAIYNEAARRGYHGEERPPDDYEKVQGR